LASSLSSTHWLQSITSHLPLSSVLSLLLQSILLPHLLKLPKPVTVLIFWLTTHQALPLISPQGHLLQSIPNPSSFSAYIRRTCKQQVHKFTDKAARASIPIHCELQPSNPKSQVHNPPSKPADYNNHSPPNLLSTIPFISTRVQNPIQNLTASKYQICKTAQPRAHHRPQFRRTHA
jgi:hypothetical protein